MSFMTPNIPKKDSLETVDSYWIPDPVQILTATTTPTCNPSTRTSTITLSPNFPRNDSLERQQIATGFLTQYLQVHTDVY